MIDHPMQIVEWLAAMANGFDWNACHDGRSLCGLLGLIGSAHSRQDRIAGRFNMHVDLSAEDPAVLERPRSLPALSDPGTPAPTPFNFDAAKGAMKNLGLSLESANGPGEFIVIDQVERPSGN